MAALQLVSLMVARTEGEYLKRSHSIHPIAPCKRSRFGGRAVRTYIRYDNWIDGLILHKIYRLLSLNFTEYSQLQRNSLLTLFELSIVSAMPENSAEYFPKVLPVMFVTVLCVFKRFKRTRVQSYFQIWKKKLNITQDQFRQVLRMSQNCHSFL